jgi:hypothetical protein
MEAAPAAMEAAPAAKRRALAAAPGSAAPPPPLSIDFVLEGVAALVHKRDVAALSMTCRAVHAATNTPEFGVAFAAAKHLPHGRQERALADGVRELALHWQALAAEDEFSTHAADSLADYHVLGDAIVSFDAWCGAAHGAVVLRCSETPPSSHTAFAVLQQGAVRFGQRCGEWFFAFPDSTVAATVSFVRGVAEGQCTFIAWPLGGVARVTRADLDAARVLARGRVHHGFKVDEWEYFRGSGRLRCRAEYGEGGRGLGRIQYFHADGATLAVRGNVAASAVMSRAVDAGSERARMAAEKDAMWELFRPDGTLAQRVAVADWTPGSRDHAVLGRLRTPRPECTVSGLSQLYYADGVTLRAQGEEVGGSYPTTWCFFRRDGTLECVATIDTPNCPEGRIRCIAVREFREDGTLAHARIVPRDEPCLWADKLDRMTDWGFARMVDALIEADE